jgi:hypothetical protein
LLKLAGITADNETANKETETIWTPTYIATAQGIET